jgi:hypothetical protein
MAGAKTSASLADASRKYWHGARSRKTLRASHRRLVRYFAYPRKRPYKRHGTDSIRNSQIANFIPAIQEITRRGGWVVRIILDVFLLSQPKWVIANNSGPAWVAATFGTPLVLADGAPIGIIPHMKASLTVKELCRLDGKSAKAEEVASATYAQRRQAQLSRRSLAWLMRLGLNERVDPNFSRSSAPTSSCLRKAFSPSLDFRLQGKLQLPKLNRLANCERGFVRSKGIKGRLRFIGRQVVDPAMSSVTSRHHSSAVLKATTRTGLEYSPSLILLTTVCSSAAASSVST